MKLALVTLCAFVATISGAPSDIETRIAGGAAVTLAKASHVVAIQDASGTIATGWIYNRQYVVTSASAIATKTPTQVVAGTTSTLRPDATSKTVAVSGAPVVHSSYVPGSGSVAHNIAVLKLSTPLDFVTGVIDSLYIGEEDTAISAVELIGWGATADGNAASSTLRSGALALKADGVDASSCDALYRKLGYTKPTDFCAGSATVSPCDFDDGAPLTQKQGVETLVIGHFSKGLSCGTNAPNSAFTRLSYYAGWLFTNAGGAQEGPVTTTPTIPTAPCLPANGCNPGK